jgi:hypothetical protein
MRRARAPGVGSRANVRTGSFIAHDGIGRRDDVKPINTPRMGEADVSDNVFSWGSAQRDGVTDMVSKAVVYPAIKKTRRTTDTGITLILVIFGLLFAVALVSAFTHPQTVETDEIMARL